MSDNDLFNQKKLDVIKNNMESCDRLTRDMLGLLDGLEEKLVQLESMMVPIYEQTQSLTTANKNIGSVIDATEKVTVHYNVASEPLESAQARTLHDKEEEYLTWVNSVMASVQFFSENKELMGAEKANKKLRDISNQAVATCKEEFSAILSSYDAVITAWPITPSYVLISETDVAKLNKIAVTLDSTGFGQVCPEELCQHRGAVVKKTLKYVIHEHVNPMRDETNEKLGWYTQGTHAILFHVQLFSLLLQLEYKYMDAILPGAVAHKQKIFYQLADLPLEYFVRRLKQHVSEEKGSNKTLVLLDTLLSLQDMQPQFQKYLSTTQVAQLVDLRASVERGLSKSIDDYVEYVTTFHGQTKAQKKAKDGTISPLTVETVAFIKRLSEFKSTVDKIDLKGSPVPKFVQQILQALEHNLENQAKTSKLETLAAVFLMNNYHYIKQHAVKGELGDCVSHYDDKLRSALQNYRRTTWGKALSFIDLEGAKQAKLAFEQHKANRKQIKAKFAGFNAALAELINTQADFSVPDAGLRAQLRAENVEEILPKYKAFLALFDNTCDFSTKRSKYVVYSPAQVEQQCNSFFGQ